MSYLLRLDFEPYFHYYFFPFQIYSILNMNIFCVSYIFSSTFFLYTVFMSIIKFLMYLHISMLDPLHALFIFTII